MAKVKLSKDGSSIDFSPSSDAIPASGKKFRQSPEILGFYSFIYENGLQREAYGIIDGILKLRKADKSKKKPVAPVAAGKRKK